MPARGFSGDNQASAVTDENREAIMVNKIGEMHKPPRQIGENPWLFGRG